jgi:hypothetical protein
VKIRLCVCDEEMCFCANTVEVEDQGEVANAGLSPRGRLRPPEVPCAECAAGHHVWTPGGERS